MNYETFTRELQAARSRGDRFTRRAPQEAVEGEALEELSTALEGLRVSQEEIRGEHQQLIEGRRTVEAERQHYRALFELAPAPTWSPTASG